MENLGRLVDYKYKIVEKILDRIEPTLYNSDKLSEKKNTVSVGYLKKQLEKAKLSYQLKLSPIIAACSSSSVPTPNGLNVKDFISGLDHIIFQIKDCFDNVKCSRSKNAKYMLISSIRGNIENYLSVNLPVYGERVYNRGHNLCEECNCEMSTDPDSSELYCNLCGSVKTIMGTVFEDSQFYNQEGQKTKSGSFNPNRHYRYWMDRILARESEEEIGDKNDPDNMYGEKVLERLRAIIARDKKTLQLLTVNDIRKMLKEIGRTDLNENVPLLLRKLTGIGPPQLPESICQRTEKLFIKAIEIGEQTKSQNRSNRNYYPYYIYKILDSILPADTIEDREMRRVLNYIYMQSSDTLAKNDRDWQKICEELEEIEWKPTIRGGLETFSAIAGQRRNRQFEQNVGDQ